MKGDFMKIAASYLSIKENFYKNLEKLINSNIDYIHVDVMDGEFVKNKTKDISELKEYLSKSTKPLDVHLMVEDIITYIDDYSELKPEYITFHIEATDNPELIINYIKSKNIKVGIALNPKTPVSKIVDYLEQVDLILIMSVEAGIGGQMFIASSIDKLNELLDIKNQKNYNFLIELDGGINEENLSKILNCDIAVVGSFITNSSDYESQIKKLKTIVDN